LEGIKNFGLLGLVIPNLITFFPILFKGPNLKAGSLEKPIIPKFLLIGIKTQKIGRRLLFPSRKKRLVLERTGKILV